MKKTLLFIFIILPFLVSAQTEFGFSLRDIKEVTSDYAEVSKRFEKTDKNTLHAVRVYIEAKENEYTETENKIDLIERDRSANIIDTVYGNQYMHLVDSVDPKTGISEQLKHLLANLGYMPQFYGNMTIAELEPITVKIRKKTTQMHDDDVALRTLHKSKTNLTLDINAAQLRIDTLYTTLYDDGNFKVMITIIFSCIVGALLLLFFLFISRQSETTLAKDFLSSGNGLQFITLFSLIIAIILFGVLGVLEGRELAAILSGISGYILGKGITKPTEPKPHLEPKTTKPAPVAASTLPEHPETKSL